MGQYNYWINDDGVNTLKGVEGDPSNRPVLDPATILFALQRSKKACDDWNKLVPVMLPDEQDRLNAIVLQNPLLARTLTTTRLGDAEQERFNDIPVRSAGPRGSQYLRHVKPNTYPTPDK